MPRSVSACPCVAYRLASYLSSFSPTKASSSSRRLPPARSLFRCGRGHGGEELPGARRRRRRRRHRVHGGGEHAEPGARPHQLRLRFPRRHPPLPQRPRPRRRRPGLRPAISFFVPVASRFDRFVCLFAPRAPEISLKMRWPRALI